jgi:hypothetical protein
VSGIEERMIGTKVFFIFENGAVSTDDVKQMRLDGNGTACVCVKGSGWEVFRLKLA